MFPEKLIDVSVAVRTRGSKLIQTSKPVIEGELEIVTLNFREAPGAIEWSATLPGVIETIAVVDVC
jgi:hypothetical protein